MRIVTKGRTCLFQAVEKSRLRHIVFLDRYKAFPAGLYGLFSWAAVLNFDHTLNYTFGVHGSRSYHFTIRYS